LLYTVIDHEPKQIDIIADQAELDISQVMVGLLNLEFKGLIRQLPGKNFIKV
jgi:DNA processing protein